jgi:hypothetical protein
MSCTPSDFSMSEEDSDSHRSPLQKGSSVKFILKIQKLFLGPAAGGCSSDLAPTLSIDSAAGPAVDTPPTTKHLSCIRSNSFSVPSCEMIYHFPLDVALRVYDQL